MERRTYRTEHGDIVYWVSRVGAEAPWLVFLPGLTADHRLFSGQLARFGGSTNCLVWDPPSHGESRPFALAWTMDDLARYLHGILGQEGVVEGVVRAECPIKGPVLVGQSMGGYVAQAFMDLYPGCAAGFVSIDSTPLKRRYFRGWELWALRHTRLMYLSIPWKHLLKLGSKGCAETPAGRALMREMMEGYGKREYCGLAAHGYRALADAVAADRPYAVDCPCELVCGTKDAAGSACDYNRRWAETESLRLHWIEGAGHNSNVDDPDAVNAVVDGLLARLGEGSHEKPPSRRYGARR